MSMMSRCRRTACQCIGREVTSIWRTAPNTFQTRQPGMRGHGAVAHSVTPSYSSLPSTAIIRE